MLRERDLSPLGFLRLDMRPAHAVSIEPHSFAIENGARLPEHLGVESQRGKFLTSRGVRRPPQPRPAADIEAIRNLPGENYLVDLESATLDIGVHYKLSSQWTLYGFATWVSCQGGFMDSSIEQFHDAVGFSSLCNT